MSFIADRMNYNHSVLSVKTNISCWTSSKKMFHSHPCFGRPFSQIMLELTVPTGRKHIANAVKRVDSSAGAGICRVAKKHSYPIFSFGPRQGIYN